MQQDNKQFNLQIISEDRLNSIEGSINQLLEAVQSIKPEKLLPKMLTSEQAMKSLQIGRWKFDQLIADNELKYIRKGRKIYVYESSINEYFGLI